MDRSAGTMTGLFCIILAGGSGRRLRPLSRGASPKQFMKFSQDLTLFQRNFINISAFTDDKNIITAVNTEHAGTAKEQLKEIQEQFCRRHPYKIIIEPVSRNTAPAAAAAVKYIQENIKSFYEEKPLILAAPSDEIFADAEVFADTLKQGIELSKNGYIVCFGVPAENIKENISYLKSKKNAAVSKSAENAFKVSDFIETPEKEDFEDTEKVKMFENTGIYLFSAETFINELKKYSKEIYSVLQELQPKESSEPAFQFAEYERMPDISIEEALISKTKKLAVLPLETEWKNIDSFENIYDISEKDEKGNCYYGSTAAAECENSFIYSSGKLAAVLGVKNMIIAASEDGAFVCSRDNKAAAAQIYEKIGAAEDEQEIQKTFFRPWGYYTVLENGRGFLTKCITVNPKAKLSLQKHFHRSEHWIILEGEAAVIKGENMLPLKAGESIDIDVEEVHSLQNPAETPLKVLEVQLGDILDENDIERLSDIYGRVPA